MSFETSCFRTPLHRLPGRLLRGALPFAVLLTTLAAVGCTNAEAGSADGSDADASISSSPSPKSVSAMPPLPDASVEGKLPRTYAGLALGDPPPAGAEKLDGAPPFYPEAAQYLLHLSESPRTNVSTYVHDGKIFRIEWRVRDASLDRDEVAEAFAERLGPPEEPSKYLPTQHVYWSDGLTDGSTTVTVFRIDDSEWFRVAFEDTGRVSELMQRRAR